MILMIDFPIQNKSRDLKMDSQNKSIHKPIDDNIIVQDFIRSKLTKLD